MAEQLACTTYSFPKTPSAPRFTTPAGGKPSPKLRLIHNAKPKKKIILRIPSPFSSSGSSSPTPFNPPEKKTPSPEPQPAKVVEHRLTSPGKITKETPSPVSKTFPTTHTSAAVPKPSGREFKLYTFPEPEWMKDGLTWEQRITAMKQRKYHLDRNYLAVPPKSNNFRPEQLDFKSLGTEHLKPPFARFWEKA